MFLYKKRLTVYIGLQSYKMAYNLTKKSRSIIKVIAKKINKVILHLDL